jgi:hydroxymethylbilane synthase
VIRLGTRGSPLALAQARLVADALAAEVEIVAIKTSGDERRRDGDKSRGFPPPPPGRHGDKSRFVKEIEDALLDGRIDLAVHSAKDVPSELPTGLAIVGVPERGDASDTLCGASSLEELPDGAVLGTSSLRRRAQLLALRPDLDIRELRGNVDTRLRRLAEGELAALVLAQAGLDRLGRGREGARLPELVPAPGQGCLALEARADDERIGAAAVAVTDRAALTCLTAERALVAELGATCRTPIAAHAELRDGALRLTAFAGMPDGSHWIRDAHEGAADAPAAVGRAVAERMAAAGAAELLEAAERAAA